MSALYVIRLGSTRAPCILRMRYKVRSTRKAKLGGEAKLSLSSWGEAQRAWRRAGAGEGARREEWWSALMRADRRRRGRAKKLGVMFEFGWEGAPCEEREGLVEVAGAAARVDERRVRDRVGHVARGHEIVEQFEGAIHLLRLATRIEC